LRKITLRRDELAREYMARFGQQWFPNAKSKLTPTWEPMDPENRVREHIEWLENELK
jgi:hypothetical protein